MMRFRVIGHELAGHPALRGDGDAGEAANAFSADRVLYQLALICLGDVGDEDGFGFDHAGLPRRVTV